MHYEIYATRNRSCDGDDHYLARKTWQNWLFELSLCIYLVQKKSRTLLRTKSMHFWSFLVKKFPNNWCQAAAEPSPVGSCPAKFRSDNAYSPKRAMHYALCNIQWFLCEPTWFQQKPMHYEKVYCTLESVRWGRWESPGKPGVFFTIPPTTLVGTLIRDNWQLDRHFSYLLKGCFIVYWSKLERPRCLFSFRLIPFILSQDGYATQGDGGESPHLPRL